MSACAIKGATAAIHIAVLTRDYAMMSVVLEYGASAESTFTSRKVKELPSHATPLHVAIYRDSGEIMHLLLDSGTGAKARFCLPLLEASGDRQLQEKDDDQRSSARESKSSSIKVRELDAALCLTITKQEGAFLGMFR